SSRSPLPEWLSVLVSAQAPSQVGRFTGFPSPLLPGRPGRNSLPAGASYYKNILKYYNTKIAIMGGYLGARPADPIADRPQPARIDRASACRVGRPADAKRGLAAPQA